MGLTVTDGLRSAVGDVIASRGAAAEMSLCGSTNSMTGCSSMNADGDIEAAAGLVGAADAVDAVGDAVAAGAAARRAHAATTTRSADAAALPPSPLRSEK